jgi:hypothetical protein
MTRAELTELLLSLQADSGAFQSTVHRGGSSFHDHNGFITALVLRELEPLASLGGWPGPIDRALCFLRECESPLRPGFFSFWPRHQWPVWYPPLPDDADDTAVIASELLHYGKIDREQAQSIASSALIAYRLETAPAVPEKPWIRPGTFLTWLDHRFCEPSQVDCVVNVNVLAFLAQAGLTSQPGYAEACQMILDGISWCARRWECLEQLSPYYPEPVEFELVLRNAVSKGVTELDAGLKALEQFPARRSGSSDPSQVVFSADRGTVWSSPALWAARQLAGDELRNHKSSVKE